MSIAFTIDGVQLVGSNIQLLGSVKISEAVVWLLAKSVFTHSAIVIGPNVVRQDPYTELPALSAEIFVPLFAEVTTTLI